MGKIIIETKGYRYTIDRPEEEIQRLLEQSLGIKIERIKGLNEIAEQIKEIKPFSMPKKIPRSREIEQFIYQQPYYRHNIKTICNHFFGKDIKSNSKDIKERNLFNNMTKKIARIRIKIQESENGNWKKERNGFGGIITYTFMRDQRFV